MKNLNLLLQLLLKNNIDFVLIGGFAGTIHGSTLVTQDLDICLACNSENLKKLRHIFKNYHPVHRMTPQKLSFLTYPETLENVANVYLNSDLGILDVLSSVIGVGDFSRVKSNSIEIKIFDHVCKVISIDDLIASKKAMNRDKDKITVKELEMIKQIKK